MEILWHIWIVSSVIYAAVFGTADATVSGWTEPNIPGAADGAGNYTWPETYTTIAYLQCTATGTVTYAIIEQPASALLQINATSGNVTVATGKTLNFETESVYVFKVTCRDSSDGTVGTATITLYVTNVDEAPEFSQTQYSLTVPDGTQEGYSLVVLTVQDPEHSTISNYIADGNADGHWILDGNTVKVAAGVTLDQDTLGGYSLEVESTDGPYTSTATMWVSIKTCSSATAAVASGLAMVLTVALSFFL